MPSAGVQFLGYDEVFFHRFATDVDNHGHIEITQVGEFLRNEAIYTDVLESDRVQHAGRSFHDALHRITGPRHARNAFNDNRTESVQIHEIDVFTTVTEGPRCRHDGVSHLDSADIHTE